MKFLHTADWHIGKKLAGYDLLEDQKAVLKQIIEIAKNEEVDAIVIAGDIYDRSVPSEESVRLVNQTIAQINLTEKFPLLVISGNHDSKTRLATGAPWFSRSDYFLHTRLEEAFTPIVIKDTAFFLLPYFEPVDARIYFDDPDIRTIQQAMPRVLEKMKDHFLQNQRHVLVSHFFVAGSMKTDSETKLEVGGLDGINGQLLKDFDYVALGHLHGKNALNLPNARYSGSPIKYSLSEKNQEKGVWIVETAEETTFQFISVSPFRDVRELQAEFSQLLDPGFYRQQNREDYLSILLEDRQVIPNMMNQLRQIYPRILQVERINGREGNRRKSWKAQEIKRKSPIDLIHEFYRAINDESVTVHQQKWIEETMHDLMKKGGDLR
ncbi:exonuclease SbcCD subunit D [Enterococcus florum]|uniref:exonuclease SbcCD subunit D n=1 Tax=Enterococcus florum TaxID=2480627 RepID=UPI0011BABEA8|nr:exonuclease SbcCD subunit D [Enterococcus florum]